MSFAVQSTSVLTDTPAQAATKIQAGFRGMRDRKKVKAEMDSLTREGKVLAEIPEAMAWKMV